RFVSGTKVQPSANTCRRPLRINPLQNPLSQNHSVRDDRMQSRRWPGALQLAELAPNVIAEFGFNHHEAMKNEVLGKILCHNICCLISAIHELGVDPVFWQTIMQ